MRAPVRLVAPLLLALVAVPHIVSAQTDEIQVYDGGLAARGKFNLTLHTNFTPNGLTTPAFAGAFLPDKSLNGVAEWAYGVTAWFEAGVYFSPYCIWAKDREPRAALDGRPIPPPFPP